MDNVGEVKIGVPVDPYLVSQADHEHHEDAGERQQQSEIPSLPTRRRQYRGNREHGEQEPVDEQARGLGAGFAGGKDGEAGVLSAALLTVNGLPV